MSVYYNDNEPFVCDWLRRLISAGHLPAGDVDCRPIQEVQADDVRRYTQVHFFAGIGGWAYALQLAQWGDRPVWTGSCPCQPFSIAGKQQGNQDPRHLWPEWFRLIRKCRPVTVFGEQVAGAIGHGWLDAVSTDMEGEGYAVGACVLGAHSVGAPHVRQRLYYVAESYSGRCEESGLSVRPERQEQAETVARGTRQTAQRRTAPMADTDGEGFEDIAGCSGPAGATGWAQPGASLLVTPSKRGEPVRRCEQSETVAAGRDVDFWQSEPDVGRVAHGVPGRMGRLRAYGNAIVPQVAAAFMSAYMELFLISRWRS